MYPYVLHGVYVMYFTDFNLFVRTLVFAVFVYIGFGFGFDTGYGKLKLKAFQILGMAKGLTDQQSMFYWPANFATTSLD